MSDYLVTLFQEWWSAVPIDWWLAEAGRTPSLLLTQEEECEVNLSQPHRARLLSAQAFLALLMPGNTFKHLTCTINVSYFFKAILNAPVQSPYMLMWFCACKCGGKEWKFLLKQDSTACVPPSANPVTFSLNALKYSAVNEHLHPCKSDCWFKPNWLKFPVDSVQNPSSWLV